MEDDLSNAAKQSSPENLRNFQRTIPCRGNAQAFTSLRISVKVLSGPPARYEERFSFSSDCRAVKQVVAPRPPAARDEDKPGPLDVKLNEGMEKAIRLTEVVP